MRKGVKISIFVIAFLAIGIGAFLGYKALTNDGPKNTAEEVQRALYNPKKQVTEDAKVTPQPKEEIYGGRFTKADFAKVIEPSWKRIAGENVNITPDEVVEVRELTKKELETLYRRQFDVYSEKMSSSEAARRFFEHNGYKRPGWVVWIFIDENPDFGYEQELVFEHIRRGLVVHHRSRLHYE